MCGDRADRRVDVKAANRSRGFLKREPGNLASIDIQNIHACLLVSPHITTIGMYGVVQGDISYVRTPVLISKLRDVKAGDWLCLPLPTSGPVPLSTRSSLPQPHFVDIT